MPAGEAAWPKLTERRFYRAPFRGPLRKMPARHRIDKLITRLIAGRRRGNFEKITARRRVNCRTNKRRRLNFQDRSELLLRLPLVPEQNPLWRRHCILVTI